MKAVLACCATGAATLVCASGAQAMTVDATGETGSCSLRAAITAVNTNDSSTPCGPVVSGGTTPINLPASTYTPFDGQLQVAAGANLALIGANPNAPAQTTIDALGGSRVLEILAGADVTLVGLTVTGGHSAHGAGGATASAPGSRGERGGGILNHGTLTLDRVLVTANRTGNGGRGGNGVNVLGDTRGGGGGGDGGPGGGIYNDTGASLTVTASTVSGNVTGDGGVGGHGALGDPGGSGHFPGGTDGGGGGWSGDGGGIYNAGTATIAASTVSGNSTGDGGNGGSGGVGAGAGPDNNAGRGGDGGDGGNGGRQYRKDQDTFWNVERGGAGIYNAGSLTMSASTIRDNTAGDGGDGGGSGLGGKIADDDYNASGRAGTGGGGGRGGGLLSGGGGINGRSEARLTNVTIARNATGDGGTGGAGVQSGSLGGGRGGYGGDGGGVWAQGARSPYTARLTHVTIAQNGIGAAGAGGPDDRSPGLPGARGEGAGIATGSDFTTSGFGLHQVSTIVAGNGLPASGDQNCDQATAAGIQDGGGNLRFPDAACPGVTGDPRLGALQDNGGPTETMLPAAGSAAIGGVALGSCTTVTDQRGFPRPGTGATACDVGAVETGLPPSSAPTTTTVASSANPSAPGQPVTFTATVSPLPDGGTLSFADGGAVLPGCGAVALAAGRGSCPATYPAAGSHTVVVTYSGTGAFGTSSSSPLTQTVQVTTPPVTTPPVTTPPNTTPPVTTPPVQGGGPGPMPGPIPAPAPPSPVARDRTRPRLTALTLTPRRVPRSRPTSRLRFSLSEAAKVTLVVTRPVPGTKARGRCRPTPRRGKGTSGCTAVTQVLRTTTSQAAGSRTLTVSLPKNPAPGRYAIAVTATDAAGNTGDARTTALTAE